MELVSIESEEENAAIAKALGKWSLFNFLALSLTIAFSAEDEYYFDFFFTSLTDNFREGQYYWESTGELLGSYSNWYEQHPEQGLHCIYIGAGSATSTLNAMWLSGNCDGNFPYICESANVQCVSNNQ
jgi:Lectin C-type domain